MHRLIALAIEELYVDRLAEHYEVLAYHFSKAEEWGKALQYLLKAAEKAAKAFANREAIALYDEVLEAVGQLGAGVDARTRMAIHQAKANVYFVLSGFDRSRDAGESLLALACGSGDRMTESIALASLGLTSLWAHDFDAALAYAGRAIDIAQEANAMSALALGHFTTGHVHTVCGRLEPGRREVDHALGSAGRQATCSTYRCRSPWLDSLRPGRGRVRRRSASELRAYGLLGITTYWCHSSSVSLRTASS